ncbi:hypothetical protein [Sneathia sanguinegens]|uniref:hypothetical protein n=1 Tax=Sneathia sanguinegens TaxID=40543 RepID=UPI0029096BAC|nr:hypothetical protein [Sneathia sanguinegens]MDU7496846.1 hypothetical protein [Sneathia sanguinegens]
MKKFLMLFIFIFSVCNFAYEKNDIEEKITLQRLKNQAEISEMIEKNEKIYGIEADLFSADEFIKKFSNENSKILNKLRLFMPDASLLDKDLKKLSENINEIEIYFAKDSYGIDIFENRTIAAYTKLKKINMYKNIKIGVIQLSKKELEMKLDDTFKNGEK